MKIQLGAAIHHIRRCVPFERFKVNIISFPQNGGAHSNGVQRLTEREQGAWKETLG